MLVAKIKRLLDFALLSGMSKEKNPLPVPIIAREGKFVIVGE
jgi:hypothetical protein